mmetsp:Transcript_27721/g.59673  ORF Transcript_27721/g.59673 Transcript_27721/m.59673 type:complete len:326 (-) Transcript_27721:921-1898(-)
MDALRARGNLLAANEDVVRVGPLGVGRVGHGVEGAQAGGELVDDVEVDPLDLGDDGAEELLVLGGDVFVVCVSGHRREVCGGIGDDLVHLTCSLLIAPRCGRGLLCLEALEELGAKGGPVLTQQAHGLWVLKAQRGARVAQVGKGELAAHGLDLRGAAGVKAVEDGEEELLEYVEHLVVVVFEGHLEVEADELGHVSVGEGLLRPEDRADLEDPVHVCHKRHLLVQLRRLREVGVATEIAEPEHVCAALGGRGDHLGGVDLGEAEIEQVLAEERARGGLHPHHPLVRGSAQVDHAIVEPRVLLDTWQLELEELCLGAACVLDLQR